MGKKKSGGHTHKEEGDQKGAKAFVLKVDMHCECDGCIDKIRAAVREITRLQGIESWDQSTLETKGELRLVATADPEKLRERLHKATRKSVKLVLLPTKAGKGGNAGGGGKPDADADAAAAQALLLQAHRHQQQYGQNAWANPLLSGGGWNAHAGYPWAVQQQQQQADPYANAVYPGGAGGWAAYPPATQGYGGAYYGGAWHGHGYY